MCMFVEIYEFCLFPGICINDSALSALSALGALLLIARPIVMTIG